MGFKTDTSFLRFLSMGARAVHRAGDHAVVVGRVRAEARDRRRNRGRRCAA